MGSKDNLTYFFQRQKCKNNIRGNDKKLKIASVILELLLKKTFYIIFIIVKKNLGKLNPNVITPIVDI